MVASDGQAWMSPEFTPGWVSVIIPTYNRAELLSAALDSLAAQDFRPIEIQLVDDGSTDETRQVASRFTDRHRLDDGLVLVCHWCNHQGASPARNCGLRHSRGEFIQFLDSDDVLHPAKLSTQVTALVEHNADFVWSSTIAYQGQPDWDAPPLVGAELPGDCGHDFVKPFIEKSCWRTESGLYRRATCVRTGPWRPLTMFQDWEYHLRMLAWSPRVRFVPGKFAGANQHDRGRIGDKWRDGTGLEGALRAIQLAEEHTRPYFSDDARWHELLSARYQEVADRAELLGLPEVASRARATLADRDQRE